MKLTCIVPCYGRPQRTIRLLNCIREQEFNEEWEAIFVGDGCEQFQKLIDDEVFRNTEHFKFLNLEKNYGGWGTICRKKGIELASGEYIIFVDNDDEIIPSHFENYYRKMKENPKIDIGYFNTYIEPWKQLRSPTLSKDQIGHSEIIIKGDILKKEYETNYNYGHDWNLIEKLINKGYLFKKFNTSPTYIIKGIGDSRETEID